VVRHTGRVVAYFRLYFGKLRQCNETPETSRFTNGNRDGHFQTKMPENDRQ
jgi:hypothetical protein